MTKIETLGPFQKTFVLINYGQMAPPNLWNVQILGRRLRKKLAIVKNPEVFEIKASENTHWTVFYFHSVFGHIKFNHTFLLVNLKPLI